MRLCQSRHLLLLLLGSWVSMHPLISRADPQQYSREDQLRAGYLFNFAHFVQWPALVPKQPLMFCFLGGVGIQLALGLAINDKQLDDHPLHVRSIGSHDSIENCQLLYVDSAAPALAAGILATPALLLVGDQHDFLHQGGMIELFTDSNRLRFSINLANIHRAGLQISSSLLQLASRVQETP